MNNASDEASVPDLGAPRSLRAPEKTDYLDILLRSLDTLIFLEIGVQYCYDNLSLLLAIRVISQVLYIQPKDPRFGQISLAPTVVCNLVCLVTHILRDRPASAVKSSRGWIHGGLLIEFIGVHGPVSKWTLLWLDVVIAGLQIMMLMVGHEKRKQSGEDRISSTASQDIEAEEAGIRKSQEDQDAVVGEQDGLEMDRLLPSGSKEAAKASSRDYSNIDLIASIDLRQTLRALTRRSTLGPQTTAASTDTDERAARLRAILSNMVLDRVASSS